MNLRAPRPGDEAFLAELSRQLGYPADPAEIVARLAELLPRDDHLVLIAVEGQEPVGWIHALIRRQLHGHAFAEITGLVVAETYRGTGIGLALLEAAEHWARDRGLSWVRVRSNVVRERAHGFYLRHGYASTKTSRVFDKDLS
jgi:GNAT superfamily N-acetyltransferase